MLKRSQSMRELVKGTKSLGLKSASLSDLDQISPDDEFQKTFKEMKKCKNSLNQHFEKATAIVNPTKPEVKMQPTAPTGECKQEANEELIEIKLEHGIYFKLSRASISNLITTSSRIGHINSRALLVGRSH